MEKVDHVHAERPETGGALADKPAKGRARTCVGCGEREEAPRDGALIRLILGPDGLLAVDPGAGGFGRGAHVHPRPACLAKAVQRGLPRAARAPAQALRVATDGGPGAADAEPLSVAALARAIRRAMERRAEGLVRAAARSRAAAIGADAVSAACARGEAALVLVACDAAAGAELPEVRRAVAEGRAAAWGTKASLGAYTLGPRADGVAVLAITSGRIAGALAACLHVADACAGAERGEAGGERAAAERQKGAPRGGGRKERAPDPGRVLAAPPENGVDEGAVARRERAPGSGRRAPTERAAAERRPRGWARRMG